MRVIIIFASLLVSAVNGAFASAQTFTIESSAMKSFFRAQESFQARQDVVKQALNHLEGRKKEIKDALTQCEKQLAALNKPDVTTELATNIEVLKSSCDSMYGSRIDVLHSYSEESTSVVEAILGDMNFDALLLEEIRSLSEEIEQ